LKFRIHTVVRNLGKMQPLYFQNVPKLNKKSKYCFNCLKAEDIPNGFEGVPSREGILQNIPGVTYFCICGTIFKNVTVR